jgi:DNA replication protein DnaC
MQADLNPEGEPENTSPKKMVQCRGCGREFPEKIIYLFESDNPRTVTVCEECADKRDTRLDEWLAICPYEFRLAKTEGGPTSLSRMDKDVPLWRKVLDWKFPTHRGLIIRGQSGRCKTRCMWRLIRRVFEERHKIIALTAGQFERQCRDAAGNYTLTSWFNKIASVDVLFLDDIGKANWSANTEANIFDLIDERTREGRPILATLNDSAEELASRLSPGRGVPLVRRLCDYCETLVF